VTADEKSYLVDIERSTKQKIPVDKDHPFHSDAAENAVTMGVGRAKAKIEAERKAGLRGTPHENRSRRPKPKTNSASKSTSSSSQTPRSAASEGGSKKASFKKHRRPKRRNPNGASKSV
jgi:ATP-dependent RNA helicase RhlE